MSTFPILSDTSILFTIMNKEGMMKYKIEYLLNVFHNLNKADVSKLNSVTAYLVARNGRKLDPIVKKFEEDRKKVLEAEWVKKYNELLETDKEEANKKYKIEVEEAEKEIRALVEEEIEFTFYTRKIEDVNFEASDIFALYDLISEEN